MATSSTLRHVVLAVQAPLKRCRLIKNQLRGTPKLVQFAATLVLVVSIVAGGYSGNSWLKKLAADKERGQRLMRRNSGLRGPEGSRTIFVPYRTSTAKVVIHPTKPMTFEAHRRLFLSSSPPQTMRGRGMQYTPPPQTKPGLNLAFLHQYLSLMSIMVPRWNSKESGLLASQAAFLLLRTYLSLVVARLDGEIVRDLVTGHGTAFLRGLIKWCGIGGISIRHLPSRSDNLIT